MNVRPIIEHMLNRRLGFDPRPLPSTTTYLVPDGPVTGRYVGNVWVPPSASTGDRRPSVKGGGHCRGSFVDLGTNRELVNESNLEAGMATMLAARRDVIRIDDQVRSPEFRTAKGYTTHVFDFVATTADGQRIAIAVKPESKVEKSGIKRTLSLIEEQIGSRFAQQYLVRTERHITADAVENAKLIVRGRRAKCSADVEAVFPLVKSIHGAVRIRDLVDEIGLGARGLNAIVNLIDQGIVTPVGHGRICERTLIIRTKENHHA